MSTHALAAAPAPVLAERRTRMTFGLVAAVYAVYLFLVLADQFSGYLVDTSPMAEPAWRFFYYFTNQSNLLVWAFLLVFAVANLGDGALAAKARRITTEGVVVGLVLYMMVVFVVVSCILQPFYTGAFEPVPVGGGLWVHVVSPILMVVFYLLYPWTGGASWRTILGWMGYLIFYVALVNVVGNLVRWRDGTRAYPYNFLNPYTYANVFLYAFVVLGLAVACFLVGVGLLRLKRCFDAGYRPAAPRPAGECGDGSGVLGDVAEGEHQNRPRVPAGAVLQR